MGNMSFSLFTLLNKICLSIRKVLTERTKYSNTDQTNRDPIDHGKKL